MKTTAAGLRRRVQVLLPGFEKYVIAWEGSDAKVQSFSSEKIYDVHIQKDGADKLDALCTCPATKLCKHIVAFYAVAKGITSMRTDKDVTESAGKSTVGHDEGKESGRQLIAAAIEQLIDGMWKVLHEKEE